FSSRRRHTRFDCDWSSDVCSSDLFAPKPKAQRNFTDPDSKIMKTADGAFHQCFNGQALVDSETQVIVACELSNAAPDAQQLERRSEERRVGKGSITGCSCSC